MPKLDLHLNLRPIHWQRIFTREEPIAGLEASDDALRLALIEPNKRTGQSELRFLVEETLPEGVVVAGTIADRTRFAAALRNLLKEAGQAIHYVILSIPADPSYLRTFSFPQSVQGPKLEESMRLAIGFQLPVKPDDVYLDWEKLLTSDDERTELLLATAPKTVVDGYLGALAAAGLHAVAVELHPLSFVRAAELSPDQTLIVTERNRTSTTLAVTAGTTVRFIRVLPRAVISTDAAIDAETKKLGDFYEAEHGTAGTVVNLYALDVRQPFATHPALSSEAGRWLTSIGAAVRGATPRSADDWISVLPVGTSQAYEYQKAILFTEFISSIVIGLSVFFAAVFVGSLFLLTNVQQRTEEQLRRLSALPVPQDAAALQARKAIFDQAITTAAPLVKTFPRWSVFLQTLKAATPAGITITSLSLPSPAATFTMSGIADTRQTLNTFRKALDSTPLFAAVELPLTNLDQRSNVPFSISFRLADPTILFST